MSAAVWMMLLVMPAEAAGRQVGPFVDEAQCAFVSATYNRAWAHKFGPQSICVKIAPPSSPK